jgi:hypothetical protein
MATIVSQRIVWFYDDELIAAQLLDGAIFVSFRRLCENLDVDRRGQIRRVERHAVLSKGLIVLDIQTEGGTQPTQCLRLDLLPLWLSGIQVSRVKEEMREKLTRYQEEAAVVLWEAFKPQILTESSNQPTTVPSTEVEQSVQELQRIAELGEAITQMARQQIEFQQQQAYLAQRLNKAGHIVKGIQDNIAGMQEDVTKIQIRLGTVEDKLHPHAYITDEQAAEVSTVVKALAEMLTRQEKGKNHYQGIFGELHRRFGVPSYKHIRQEQYASVLSFLDDWRNAAMEENQLPEDS